MWCPNIFHNKSLPKLWDNYQNYGQSLWRSRLSQARLQCSSIHGYLCILRGRFLKLSTSLLLFSPFGILGYVPQTIPELPIMWHARIHDGVFIFADEHHLCHKTEAARFPLERLTLRSNGHGHEWVPFNIKEPIDATPYACAIFKAARMRESDCVGLEHFVPMVAGWVFGTVNLSGVYTLVRRTSYQRVILCPNQPLLSKNSVHGLVPFKLCSKFFLCSGSWIQRTLKDLSLTLWLVNLLLEIYVVLNMCVDEISCHIWKLCRNFACLGWGFGSEPWRCICKCPRSCRAVLSTDE